MTLPPQEMHTLGVIRQALYDLCMESRRFKAARILQTPSALADRVVRRIVLNSITREGVIVKLVDHGMHRLLQRLVGQACRDRACVSDPTSGLKRWQLAVKECIWVPCRSFWRYGHLAVVGVEHIIAVRMIQHVLQQP